MPPFATVGVCLGPVVFVVGIVVVVVVVVVATGGSADVHLDLVGRCRLLLWGGVSKREQGRIRTDVHVAAACSAAAAAAAAACCSYCSRTG